MKLICEEIEKKVSFKFSFDDQNGEIWKDGTLSYSTSCEHPTWFPILSRAMQTIMPFTRDDEEVFVHTLIRLGNARNQPNRRDSTLKVITRFFPLLEIINPIYVMSLKVSSHFPVYHVYTTEDPKKVRRTLGQG